MLPLDYTFCSGLRCDRNYLCARYLTPQEKARIPEGKPISMAQFADHDGKCEEHIPRRASGAQAETERKP